MTGPTPTCWRYSDSHAFMEKVREGMPPVMIVVACNGGLQGKEYNEAIPETPDEIADSVYDAYVAGASVVHVHARHTDDVTRCATRTDQWIEVNSKIRARCPDIIINNTTGGDLGMTMEERLSCLDAGPEIASLNLTPEMARFALKERKAPLRNPRPPIEEDACIPFTYGLVNRFASEMQKRGIKPELETYHTGGVWVVRDLIEKGLIETPYLIQTVMGTQSASYPTPAHVLHILNDLPDETVWLCSGIGPFQLPITTFALLMGGHVRVGLEDNIYYRRGEKMVSNAQPVERVVRLARELNRTIATPAEARAMLGLSQEPSQY